ncbi:MAG: type II toxin-antitoxin system VapC family toxin [Proteobacteria bacterium]|nr:type II toxin-antitoxin system VapC family toxin [Pseudomonadota bacterium]
MKILVDTHIFLWMLAVPEKLSEKRRYELESPANEIFLSSISIAEMMIKQSIGKLVVNFDPLEMAGEMGLELLDFTGKNAVTLGSMPLYHKDPFDRMLMAQAIDFGLKIMTDDEKFGKYPCKIM